MRLRDVEVRHALHEKVLRKHRDAADTLVLDELGLRNGNARVDVVVVNGQLHGFEIKSEADTLDRLSLQVPIYGEVLDRVTLVVAECHAAEAAGVVPTWWGVKVVTVGGRGTVHFRTLRSARMNPSLAPVAVAELLWRGEALALLETCGAAQGLRGRRRHELFAKVAEVLPLHDLRAAVRRALRARPSWRVAASRT